MQCIRPLKASFDSQGNITFSAKQAERGLVPFRLPCNKCLPCNLNKAREKGVRAWHEMKYHKESMFLTLTYKDEHLTFAKHPATGEKYPTLVVKESQDFIKRLRKSLNHPISVVTTGEYGTKTKRPHWHYLIFGHYPRDAKKTRETDFGPVSTSETLSELWENKGKLEIGSVTLESASYVARYGAKSLGNQDPAFKPHHRTGSKRALGKSWIEENYKHTFENGFINIPSGEGYAPSKIPRYYVDWAKENTPELWFNYVKNIKPELELKAAEKERRDELEFFTNMINYQGGRNMYPLHRNQIDHIILKHKFATLVQNWSL